MSTLPETHSSPRISGQTHKTPVGTVIRKPRLFWHVLLHSRKVHFATLAVVGFLVFLAPPILNRGLRVIFPKVEEKKLLGLVKQKVDSRPYKVARKLLGIAFIIGGTGYVVRLLWLHLPHGVRRAEEEAAELELQADDLSLTDAQASLHLYRKAAGLTADSSRESRLVTKIQELEALTEDRSDDNPSVIGAGNRFRVEERLGQGGMGVVYRAVDTVLDRQVALKELPARLTEDDEYVARFHREAKALARLTHPAIVQVFDLIEQGDRLYMALELVDGGDLAMLLHQQGRLELSRAMSIATTLADGLAYAHEQGVVHRDFKPANVLLMPDGQPKITDFGLARLAQASHLTQEGTIMGSPRYMSPEQAAGKPAGVESDIYSFGICLYEMLTGAPPFDGDTQEVLAQQITQPPRPLAELRDDLPEQLVASVMSMLAKDPADRPADMIAVASSLRAVTSRFQRVD